MEAPLPLRYPPDFNSYPSTASGPCMRTYERLQDMRAACALRRVSLPSTTEQARAARAGLALERAQERARAASPLQPAAEGQFERSPGERGTRAGLEAQLRTETAGKILERVGAERGPRSFARPADPVHLSRLGGLGGVLGVLRELAVWPYVHAASYVSLGVPPPTGLLISGCSGSGKTSLVHGLVNEANELLGGGAGEASEAQKGKESKEGREGAEGEAAGAWRDGDARGASSASPTSPASLAFPASPSTPNPPVTFLPVNASEIITSKTGESEEILRAVFREALDRAPSVLLLDNVDLISTRQDAASREMERRVTTQLCSCLDEVASACAAAMEAAGASPRESADAAGGAPSDALPVKRLPPDAPAPYKHVLVIGVTSRLSALEPALRRAGRFDREVMLPIPTKAERLEMLRIVSGGMKLSPGLDLMDVAGITPGYVGADIKALCREAAMQAVRRSILGRASPAVGSGCQTQKPSEPPGDRRPPQAPASASSPQGDEEPMIAPVTVLTRMHGRLQQPRADSHEAHALREPRDPRGQDPCPARGDSQDSQSSLEILELTDSQEDPPPPQLAPSCPPSSNFITLDDFRLAAASTQPASLREGFATVPDVTMKDIGALASVKRELDLLLLQPLRDPERFARLGIKRLGGLILFSCPGQGKTMICKALSAQAEVNFISVKGPELLNMYYGESERAIRNVFARARASAPCCLFLDEFDSLARRRGSRGSASDVGDKIVNTLLTELDGIHTTTDTASSADQAKRQAQIFVVAATNRIDLIDPGLMRPGRLDKVIYIPMPGPEERVEILEAVFRSSRVQLEHDLQGDVPSRPGESRLGQFLRGVSSATENFTGADLASVVREAGMAVVREGAAGTAVGRRHILAALKSVKRSVSDEELRHYESLAKRIIGMEWKG